MGFYFSLSTFLKCLNLLRWILLVLCHLKQKVILTLKNYKAGKTGVPARGWREVRLWEETECGALEG